MTLTPGTGGIFQFLTELVAQTTVQHGPLGHDLSFRITSNTLQALLWYTIPSSVKFHFLSHCHYYPFASTSSPAQSFPQVQTSNQRLPPSPILRSSTLPAVSHSPPGFALTDPLVRSFFPELESSFLITTGYTWFLFNKVIRLQRQ